MLDKILEMVSGDALNAMTEKAGVSMNQAKQILPLAGDSFQEGLLSQVTGGNVNGVLAMFKSFPGGGLENNYIFRSIKNLFLKKVMTNMDLPESVAALVAGSGMKSIIGTLAGKIQSDGVTNDIDAVGLMNVLGRDSMFGNLADMTDGNEKEEMTDNLKDAAVDKLGKLPTSHESGSFDISIKG